jgi:uncharacterized protein
MNNFPILTDHILIFLYGIVIPFFSGVKSRENFEEINFTENIRKRFYLANSLFLGLAAGVIIITWWIYKRPFAAMGFKSPVAGIQYNWAIAISILLGVLYIADLVWSVRKAIKNPETQAEQDASTPFLPHHIREIPAYLVMCVAAGVFEEIMYRGYMVTYFLPQYNQSSGWPILAAIAPAFLFSLAHYYQGWLAMMKIFLLSMLLGLIFILSESLYIVMGIHFAIDLIGGLLAMRYLRKEM